MNHPPEISNELYEGDDLRGAGWLVPDWSACGSPLPKVRALTTTRLAHVGRSRAPFDAFNLATHVGDEPEAVAANRQLLRRLLPSEPFWLDQVHGTAVVEVGENWHRPFSPKSVSENDGVPGEESPPVADASFTRQPGRVCVVLTADCLPVLLAAREGQVVAAIHAGWRGLAAGIIESTVAAMGVCANELLAWLGPAIGPLAFEVGTEVRAEFCEQDSGATQHFAAHGEKWLCDLPGLARRRLIQLGIPAPAIAGGRWCTFNDPQFYSYRREAKTGRMASMIWIEA